MRPVVVAFIREGDTLLRLVADLAAHNDKVSLRVLSVHYVYEA